MADRIQHRRDTAERWSQFNPILLEGEVGYVTDEPTQYKIGDGINAWNNLPLRGFNGNILQTTGSDENAVMSQKAVTDHYFASEVSSKYNFPITSFTTGLTESDISITKPSNDLLKIVVTKELYFYYRTQNSTGNYLRLLLPINLEIPLIPFGGTDPVTSAVNIGIIFNPKTAKDITGSRLSYIIIPSASAQLPIDLEEGEVFAPIMIISNVINTPVLSNGTLYEQIIGNRSVGLLGDYISKYDAQVTCINASFKGISIVRDGNNVNVNISQNFIYMFKTQNETNYLYPDVQTFTCDLTPLISVLVIGLVINYKTSNGSTNVRYGWYCSQNGFSSSRLELAKDEVFCPVLFVRVLPDIKMVGGTLYDFINQKIMDLVDKYSYPVNTASNGITLEDISLSKYTENDINYMEVDIKKRIIFNSKFPFKTGNNHEQNFLYPLPQKLTIPTSEYASIAQIGIVFDPINISDITNCRYDYILIPNYSDVLNPILAEGEVFAPIFNITGIGTTTPKITSGNLYNKIINEKVLFLEDTVKNLSIVNKDSNPLVYSMDFKNSDLTEWSNAFISDTNGVKMNPNTYYWLKRLYRINKRVFEFDFNTSTASKFTVNTHGLENGLAGTDTLFFTVDIANNMVNLSYNNTNLNYNFTANKDYRIKITQNDRVLNISVIDLASGVESDKLQYIGISENKGLLYDSISFQYTTGDSIILKKFVIYSSVKNPKIIFFGDSITVGYTSSIVDGLSKNGYAELTGDAMNLPYLTSGRGGGTIRGFFGESTYIGRFITELTVLKPNFAMVTIGTNGGNNYADYKRIVDFILSYGVVPILNNIPLREDESYVSATNDAINQIRREYGISGARFDLATSVNNDGVTFDNSLFIEDKIHPNDAGHLAMFNRIKLDVPELF